MAPTTTDLRRTSEAPLFPAALGELAAPVETLQFLREPVGLTQGEIAAMLGTDDRTVRRWLDSKNDSKPGPRFSRGIDDLRDLVGLLIETLPGEQTARWLRARSRLLKSDRPIELLAKQDEDAYRAVREAAEAFVDGDPV
jgi:predicted transcriptional regulator